MEQWNKITEAFLRLSEAEIQGLLDLAEANPRYFIAWFQSLQLPPTHSELSLALIPLASTSHVSFLRYVLELWIEFFIFYI
jgi:hypothetical protein